MLVVIHRPSLTNSYPCSGLEVPSGHDDDDSVASAENVFHKVTRLESKLHRVEREQRELTSQQRSNALRSQELEDHDAQRIRDRQQLEAKVLALSDDIAQLTARLEDVQNKAVSEDVLMHTHVRLLEQMQGENNALKKKIKALSAHTAKACRALDDGLQDAQGTSVELLSFCEQVQTALNAAPHAPSVELRSPKLRRSASSRSRWEWDAADGNGGGSSDDA